MARLFIPGPTDVPADTLAAQARPMVGHRSREFTELFARLQPGLRQVFGTQQRVIVVASSGSGLQEAAVRNCVARRLVVCVGGAFADRWFDIARANGVDVERVEVAWGRAHEPEQVAAALRRGGHDALAIVHNESSTGVENPVGEIAVAARQVRPDVVVLVDAVSSAGGVPIEAEARGLDVVLTSSQKCFALPPGLAFAAVSDRALARAAEVKHRGWYFDFLLLDKHLQQAETPATPAISLMYALEAQLQRMLGEGLEARYQRHAAMAALVQRWASERFALFAQEGFRSKTVTAIRNTRGIEITALSAHLSRFEMTIADGYGPLKGKTFRIGHMGEIRLQDVEELLAHIDEFLQSTDAL
ncbi:MAG: alanine--glyoxylate aminotransferase family protein [Chloroflexota bacterium]